MAVFAIMIKKPIYVPPVGDEVNFLFEGSYSPPLGDEVNFDFDA